MVEMVISGAGRKGRLQNESNALEFSGLTLFLKLTASLAF